MPGMRCAIGNCSNTFTKFSPHQTNYISFHRFPKDDKLRKSWIKACYRKDNFNPNSSFVFSKHFTDDFEINFMPQLLNTNPRRRLKQTGKQTGFYSFHLHTNNILFSNSNKKFKNCGANSNQPSSEIV